MTNNEELHGMVRASYRNTSNWGYAACKLMDTADQSGNSAHLISNERALGSMHQVWFDTMPGAGDVAVAVLGISIDQQNFAANAEAAEAHGKGLVGSLENIQAELKNQSLTATLLAQLGREVVDPIANSVAGGASTLLLMKANGHQVVEIGAYTNMKRQLLLPFLQFNDGMDLTALQRTGAKGDGHFVDLTYMGDLSKPVTHNFNGTPLFAVMAASELPSQMYAAVSPKLDLHYYETGAQIIWDFHVPNLAGQFGIIDALLGSVEQPAVGLVSWYEFEYKIPNLING